MAALAAIASANRTRLPDQPLADSIAARAEQKGLWVLLSHARLRKRLLIMLAVSACASQVGLQGVTPPCISHLPCVPPAACTSWMFGASTDKGYTVTTMFALDMVVLDSRYAGFDDSQYCQASFTAQSPSGHTQASGMIHMFCQEFLTVLAVMCACYHL